MLRNVNKLDGMAIGATDGPIGKVKDFYFDDEAWVVRYVVVDTSKWLGTEFPAGRPWSSRYQELTAGAGTALAVGTICR